MKNFVILMFCLYLCQNATAYCCFRDPFMLPTTPCTNMCGSSCTNIASSNCGSPCNCGVSSCKCFRDPADVCNVCETPSPVCQCMSKCGCDGLKYPIYFPEVQYPVTILEIEPFFYRTCFSI